MRKITVTISSLVLLTTVWLVKGGLPVPAAPDPGIAVVELFTSEGCSSCPPAEEVFARLSDSSRPIFALSYHVDYWDYLGWKDPFSQNQFTRLQQEYSGRLSSSVYTPQAVVNGDKQCVGSQAVTLQGYIDEAIKRSPQAHLRLTTTLTGSTLQVRYTVLDGPPGKVNLALVERGLQSEVLRGENAGRLLHHENVVRGLQVATGREGSLSFPLAAGLHWENCSVIAFLADSKGHIAGATANRIK